VVCPTFKIRYSSVLHPKYSSQNINSINKVQFNNMPCANGPKQQPWKASWPPAKVDSGTMHGFAKGQVVVMDGNAGNIHPTPTKDDSAE